MSFNYKQFFSDYNLKPEPKGSWLNIYCPFCHGGGKYLGYNFESGGISCWKCGKHSLYDLTTTISSLTWSEIKDKYITDDIRPSYKKKKKEYASNFIMPKNFTPITKVHKQYITGRGFDADYIIKKYNLLSTARLSNLSNRIVMPVKYKNEIVSYTTRAMTDEGERYIACSPENEARPIKSCLYGLDDLKGSSVVVVEGVTDQWNLGNISVATFGTKLTDVQILLLSRFKNIFIMFDKEAESVALDLGHKLGITCNVEIVDIPNPDIDDPAELTVEEVEKVKKELGF